MCGIAGICSRGIVDGAVDVMLDQLVHRGGDSRDTYQDRHSSIGNTLLSIVDYGSGRQPFVRSRRQETYVGVLNGVVYNYREIRSELEELGLGFETDCDTEVVLAAYTVWGDGAVEKFDGQWALAIWEARRRRLFMSRDPFGIKPLYYNLTLDTIAFASEPKAILALPSVQKRPDVTAIREYFLHGFTFAAGYCSSHRSFYDGIDSLPPGHSMTWDAEGGVETTRYFDFPVGECDQNLRMEEAAHELSDAMMRSTKACMIGDRRLGVALSGGLDSSAIASIAARLNVRGGQGEAVPTSCINYRSDTVGEDWQYANQVAEWLQEQGYPVFLSETSIYLDSYLSDLDDMVRHFDEPHWEVKQIAMYANYGTLRNAGAHVVLTGEGADELFFGYYHRFPGFKNPVIRSSDEFLCSWARRLPVVLDILNGVTESCLRDLQEEAIERHYTPYIDQGPERAMQCWYLSTFLHWLLLDNDRCSMAHTIEGRFPFLGSEVVRAAMRIPPRMNVGSVLGEEKLVLRKALEGLLPKEIWKDRSKAPLPSPRAISYHEMIARALEQELDSPPDGIFDVISKEGAMRLSSAYWRKIKNIKRSSVNEVESDALTSYLTLNSDWDIRTPHAFGLLTLFRWWRMNFQ